MPSKAFNSQLYKNTCNFLFFFLNLILLGLHYLLTLKAPRKKMHLKMSSDKVVCCKYRSSLIWVHTVCHRGFLNSLADDFVAIGNLRVKNSLYFRFTCFQCCCICQDFILEDFENESPYFCIFLENRTCD